ncbi:dissimilatory-type sulfite reductase subunit alpha [Magnetofaba australis]|uniref:Putative sulfite reductase, dissimilatory-type subunit alpha n=1 Tax=Magnetofaba australis IT-1 TaxID=1434232 RepID=A0A1Y2K710_9PROT|nr:dissimilatory-type sulfite reductase subunit alpha [Magnetofaba australis]OSM05097.1 putative sulfite reductase, dissimilatory-type subunit alpha [Magnetofaba australis IT-1]
MAENENTLNPTPNLDQLETGPWPSFITGYKDYFKRTGKTMVRGVLDQLNYSYETKMGYWKGGVVGVHGYGAGIISRYSMIPELFPEAKECHTMRIQPAPGLHYTSKHLREICDIWEKYGSGMISMHGQTGNLQLQGIVQDNVQECFDDLNKLGWDLGGAGATVRTGASCIGPARCEMACYDTLEAHHRVLTYFTDLVHRPQLPYKAKFKFSGCPNDCCNSIQRSDYSVIGTWRDDIQVDEAEVKNYLDDVGVAYFVNNVQMRCPTNAITLNEDQASITIDNSSCVRCMHCINVMTKALSPGKDKGITLLVGGKGHLKVGNMLGSVMVPFMKLETDEDYDAFTDLIDEMIDYWAENGLDHERIGETIERVGMQQFLDAVGLDAIPDMVKQPRDNPFFKADYEAAG